MQVTSTRAEQEQNRVRLGAANTSRRECTGARFRGVAIEHQALEAVLQHWHARLAWCGDTPDTALNVLTNGWLVSNDGMPPGARSGDYSRACYGFRDNQDVRRW